MRRRHAQERSRCLFWVPNRLGPVQEVMQQRLPAGRTAAPPSAAKGTGLFAAEQVGSHVLEFAGSRLSNAEASIGRRRQRCLCRRSHRRAKTRTAIIWLLLSVIAFQQTS